MAGKIKNFFRETQFIFSIILTILGFIVIIIGMSGMWFQSFWTDIFRLSLKNTNWALWILIIGFLVLGTGMWYLYSFLMNRKFILEEIKTNKRSEFVKKHTELKNKVKHMPNKFKKMVKDKEDELKIK